MANFNRRSYGFRVRHFVRTLNRKDLSNVGSFLLGLFTCVLLFIACFVLVHVLHQHKQLSIKRKAQRPSALLYALVCLYSMYCSLVISMPTCIILVCFTLGILLAASHASRRLCACMAKRMSVECPIPACPLWQVIRQYFIMVSSSFQLLSSSYYTSCQLQCQVKFMLSAPTMMRARQATFRLNTNSARPLPNLNISFTSP